MRVAVIGAGMGGLAAASLLSDLGHDITLFDQFDTPKPVGSGLLIQPVGQTVLAEIGALDQALGYGNAVTQMLGVEADHDRPVLNVRYDLIHSDAFGLAIHRAALFDALWSALQRRRGIELVTSAKITGVSQDADSISVMSQAGA